VLVASLVAVIVLGGSSASAIVGDVVADGNYRFTAKIEVGSSVRSCSGALISPDWLLTAKQCFVENTTPGAPAHATKATIGKTSLSSSAGEVVDVVHVIPRSDRDLALAKLSRPVTVPTVEFGSAPAATNDVTRIAGYGRTSAEWVPDRLHAGTFTVQNVTSTTFAVDTAAPDQPTICKGDAGGPVFRDNNGTFQLIGIAGTSWQGGCLSETEARRGGVATRFDDIIGWIQTNQLAPVAVAQAKSITVSWKMPTASGPVPNLKLYGSTDPAVPIGQQTLLAGPGRLTTFTHQGLKPKQTWFYKVVMVDSATGLDGPVSTVVSAKATGVLQSDFNGDRKEDIATFVQGSSSPYVYVSRSTGQNFMQDNQVWHDSFAPQGQLPLSGDFNGDGRADTVAFTRGNTGDVWVSLSTGTGFGPATQWHGDFGFLSELPAVGDVNGDGKDDIVVFTRGSSGFVYVALSTGSTFKASEKWHGFFAPNAELPAVGDVNGDGKDDIITFHRGPAGDGQRGDVYVALSTGVKFGDTPFAPLWHDFFAVDNEIPGVGDFDGDGMDDIVVFARGTGGDVYVALSKGAKFGDGPFAPLWHNRFTVDNEIPGVGDFNGDGKDDVIVFVRGNTGNVYVAPSEGAKFKDTAPLWHNRFAVSSEVPVPRLIP
jgi:V8-like Glu-specific endopeptidase